MMTPSAAMKSGDLSDAEIDAFIASYDRLVKAAYPDGPTSNDYTSIVDDKQYVLFLYAGTSDKRDIFVQLSGSCGCTHCFYLVVIDCCD